MSAHVFPTLPLSAVCARRNIGSRPFETQGLWKQNAFQRGTLTTGREGLQDNLKVLRVQVDVFHVSDKRLRVFTDDSTRTGCPILLQVPH